MELRDRDAIDYLFVGVVTVLAYLELPWRPEIRAWLLERAAELVAFGSLVHRLLFAQPLWVYVIVGVLLGLAILVAIVELPKVRHA